MNEKSNGIFTFTKKTIIIVSALLFLVGGTCALMYFEIIPMPPFFSITPSSITDETAAKERQNLNKNVSQSDVPLLSRSAQKCDVSVDNQNKQQFCVDGTANQSKDNAKQMDDLDNQHAHGQDFADNLDASPLHFKSVNPPVSAQHINKINSAFVKQKLQAISHNLNQSSNTLQSINNSQIGLQQPSERIQSHASDEKPNQLSSHYLSNMISELNAFVESANELPSKDRRKLSFYDFGINNGIRDRKACKAYHASRLEIFNGYNLTSAATKKALCENLKANKANFTDTTDIGFIYVLAVTMVELPDESKIFYTEKLMPFKNKKPSLLNLYTELACHIQLRGHNKNISLAKYDEYLYTLPLFVNNRAYLKGINDLNERARQEIKIMKEQQVSDWETKRTTNMPQMPYWDIEKRVDKAIPKNS